MRLINLENADTYMSTRDMVTAYLIGRFGLDNFRILQDAEGDYLVISVPDEEVCEESFLNKLSGDRDIEKEIKQVLLLL